MLQRTDEWYQARLGKVTASRISDVLYNREKPPTAARKSYRNQLVAERLTGTPTQKFVTREMQRGIDLEQRARDYYAFIKGVEVSEAPFVSHPDIPMSGASPDFLVLEKGLGEVKCPNTNNHIETIITGEVKKEYIYQMMWQMACTGREYCDYISFDDRLSVGKGNFYCKRVERDDDLIAMIEENVISFLKEVSEAVETVEEMEYV